MVAENDNEFPIESLSRDFRGLWENDNEIRFFQTPGRVNLIGEHTDYNEGYVFPVAVNYSAMIAAQLRNDDRIEAYSRNFNELKSFSFADVPVKQSDEWINYVEGVARVLRDKGCEIGGANLLIDSSVPVGAGLSSSAAIEIGVGLSLLAVNNQPVDKLKLALAGQLAEHEYVGAKSGIMDQFVCVFGEKDNALLIDCRELDAKNVSLKLNDAEIIVCNSGVKHALANGEYNVRRAECEQGVSFLKEYLPNVKSLRDVEAEEFERFANVLPETIKRRCRHVITENARTLEAAKVFKSGDVEKAGELMSQSHASLRDDYEVSCEELDLLVSIADNFAGVYGARMTGGGFGGCIVALVENGKSDEFARHVQKEYESWTNIRPDVFRVKASDGAKEVKASEIEKDKAFKPQENKVQNYEN